MTSQVITQFRLVVMGEVVELVYEADSCSTPLFWFMGLFRSAWWGKGMESRYTKFKDRLIGSMGKYLKIYVLGTLVENEFISKMAVGTILNITFWSLKEMGLCPVNFNSFKIPVLLKRHKNYVYLIVYDKDKIIF